MKIVDKACEHLEIDSKVNVIKILVKAGAEAKGVVL